MAFVPPKDDKIKKLGKKEKIPAYVVADPDDPTIIYIKTNGVIEILDNSVYEVVIPNLEFEDGEIIDKYKCEFTTKLTPCYVSGNYQVRQYSNLKPTGYVVDTFECVLKHFTNANDFKDGIISAVNEGGDADTIAAIAGGALGAKFEIEDIPNHWVDKLDSNVKQKLDEFADFIMR